MALLLLGLYACILQVFQFTHSYLDKSKKKLTSLKLRERTT